MATRGYCRYCERRDAVVYVQPKEVHNQECRECWGLYSAIRDWKGRVRGRGNCRQALRLALAEIMRPQYADAADSHASDNDAVDDPADLDKIRAKVLAHPCRTTDSIDRAVQKIVRELS